MNEAYAASFWPNKCSDFTNCVILMPGLCNYEACLAEDNFNKIGMRCLKASSWFRLETERWWVGKGRVEQSPYGSGPDCYRSILRLSCNILLPQNLLCIPTEQPNRTLAPQIWSDKLQGFHVSEGGLQTWVKCKPACTMPETPVSEVCITHVLAQMGY